MVFHTTTFKADIYGCSVTREIWNKNFVNNVKGDILK